MTTEGEARELQRATITAYLDTLERLQRYAAPFKDGFVQQFQQNLKKISSQLEGHASPGALKQTSSRIGEELKSLWDSGCALVLRWEEESRGLITVLSEAARGLDVKDRNCKQIFERFSDRVDQISQESDLREIRQKLRREVTELKCSLDELLQENKAMVAGMRHAVQKAEQSYQQASKLAMVDALTELPNRRHAEAVMRAKIGAGEVWSVILFDVNRFKEVNDVHGHAFGDAVLKRVGELLRAHSRPNDVVCRWAGDEFVAIVSGDILIALEIQDRLLQAWGKHRVQSGSVVRDLVIRASGGICQHLPTETLEEVMARADVEMYREKAAGSGGR